MHKKIIGIFVCMLLVGTVLPISRSLSLRESECQIIDDQLYVKPSKKLISEHLSYLKQSLSCIDNIKIKQVLQEIINEILDNGDATSDEIQDIVASRNAGFDEVYILAEVKTTENTDGDIFCFPGTYRSFFGFHAKGIYVKYATWGFSPLYGWHLHINGNLVSEKEGYIFGYFGYALCVIDVYGYFLLDGYGILILHGKSYDQSYIKSNSQQYSNSLLLRFLEQFPILQKILQHDFRI